MAERKQYQKIRGTGKHVQFGQNVPDGAIVETALPLDKLFVNKFLPLTPQDDAIIIKDPVKEVAPEVIADPEEEVKEPGTSPFGKDVTENYPSAKDADMKVFQKGNGITARFTITDEDDIEKALNKDPLKKGDVEGFLGTYLSE